jgi:hypothetical protein
VISFARPGSTLRDTPALDSLVAQPSLREFDRAEIAAPAALIEPIRFAMDRRLLVGLEARAGEPRDRESAKQPPMTSTSPTNILREVFGYRAFRGAQADIVTHVTDGGDALVLMPPSHAIARARA